MRRKSKRILKNGFLVIASFLLVLLVLEAVIRGLDLAPKVEDITYEGYIFSTNPKLRYVPRPNGQMAGPTININKDGYRGKICPVKKKSGDHVRIMSLGDSVTFGCGLAEDEATYCSKLETILNKDNIFGKSWEVMNFGVSGYNTINEVEYLKVKGLKYDPDIVILQTCVNDNSNDSDLQSPKFIQALQENKTLLYYLVNPALRSLSRSKLFLFCAVRIKALQRHGEKNVGDLNIWLRNNGYIYDGDIIDIGLNEFSIAAQKNGFKPLVLIFPEFEGSDKFSDYTSDYDYITDTCGRLGLQYINLLDYFRKVHDHDATKLHWCQWHPTAYGNQVIAEIIKDEIVKRGLQGK